MRALYVHMQIYIYYYIKIYIYILYIQDFKRNVRFLSLRTRKLIRLTARYVNETLKLRIKKDRAICIHNFWHLTIIKASWSRRRYTDHDNRDNKDSHAQQLSPLIALVVHLAR